MNFGTGVSKGRQTQLLLKTTPTSHIWIACMSTKPSSRRSRQGAGTRRSAAPGRAETGEELARLQATALLYYEQTRSQAARIRELEEALAGTELTLEQVRAGTGLKQEIADVRKSLAAKDELVSRLRSALVAKERARFDLELKLRSLLERGTVTIEVRSSATRAHEGTEPAQVSTASGLSKGPSLAAGSALRDSKCLDYRSMLTQLAASGPTLSPRYPGLAAPTKGFVFILTYPRSGDLVLQEMLNDIPGYCIRGELGGALEPIANAWGETVVAGQSSDKDDLEVASLNFGWVIADSFVTDVLAPPQNVKVAGFRTNTVHTDLESFWRQAAFLYSNFPNARLLFNMRNNERVARSGPWARQPRKDALRKLQRMDAFFKEFTQAYPERCLCVNYDDYASSQEERNRIFKFLGEAEFLNLVHEPDARKKMKGSADAIRRPFGKGECSWESWLSRYRW
jgi:hypothetical protein